MDHTRREFIKTAGVTASSLALPLHVSGSDSKAKKRHIVTLSFDDGFKKSSIKTAEIHEKHKLSACINVVASAHMKDFRPPDYPTVPRGDFGLWNELQARGHEVMPHSYKHANLRQTPLAEAKDLILRCLDVFSKELKGFDPKKAVYNFAYNASTPELEAWLPTQVKAFRTKGGAITPLPHKGQVKLTCTGFGPGNCDQAIDREIEKLLAQETGWLIFNTHGLDDEGWGPISATYLDRLLGKLSAIESVDVLPAGRALERYVNAGQLLGLENMATFQSTDCEGTYSYHVQGICTNEQDAIYWCFTTALVKTDTQGRTLKKIPVANHHGDLCFHDGKLYVAVNLGRFNDPAGNADSWVYVYNADDLSLLAKHETQEVFHGAGGIGFHDGHFFVVGGLPDTVDENYVYEYDAEFKFAKKHVIKSGHTHLGIQTAAYANDHWWFGCYGDPRVMLKTDSSFGFLGKYEFDCSLGIVGLPGGRFLVATGPCKANVGCTGSVAVAHADAESGMVVED